MVLLIICIYYKVEVNVLCIRIHGAAALTANGPAIWGGCVTRHKHRAGSWYPAPAGPQSCHGARRVWRGFCRPGTNFVGYTSVAVQGWSGVGNKSSYTKFYCGHWRGRGISHYKFVKGVGAKAKTMTNNLPILSVLLLVILFFCLW